MASAPPQAGWLHFLLAVWRWWWLSSRHRVTYVWAAAEKTRCAHQAAWTLACDSCSGGCCSGLAALIKSRPDQQKFDSCGFCWERQQGDKPKQLPRSNP